MDASGGGGPGHGGGWGAGGPQTGSSDSGGDPAGGGAPERQDDGVRLSDSAVRSLAVGAVFDAAGEVTGFDFHRSSDVAVSSCRGAEIYLFNTARGRLTKTLKATKHGCSHVTFSHHPSTVLVAANTESSKGMILYHSLHDNKYLRYFHAHTEHVTAISMSPVSDVFYSSASDGLVHIWDLNQSSPKPVGSCPLRLPGAQLVSASPDGNNFAILASNGLVSAFDVRKYDVPTETSAFRLPAEATSSDWAELAYSPAGDLLAVASRSDGVRVFDASRGLEELVHIEGKENGGINSVTFSPDSQFIVAGCGNKTLQIYAARSGKLVMALGGHAEPVVNVRWHPEREMLASSGAKTALWLPNT